MNMSSWISSRDEWLREGERNDGLSPLRESGDIPVYFRGAYAGTLSHDDRGAFRFAPSEAGRASTLGCLPGLSRESDRLFGVFKSLLSERRRYDRLVSLFGRADPLCLLTSIRDHPALSFDDALAKDVPEHFPEVPFGDVVAGTLSIPEDVLRSVASRRARDVSLFSGTQDKIVVVAGPDVIRLPEEGERGNAILKTAPSWSRHASLPAFVANEHLFCSLAARIGLDCAKSVLVDTGLPDIGDGLLSRRFDVAGDEPQLFVEAPVICGTGLGSDSEKYDFRAEELVTTIPKEDAASRGSLAEGLFFSMCIGNTDMHLRNFSFVVSGSPACGMKLRPAPLYDVSNLAVYNLPYFALLFDTDEGARRLAVQEPEDVETLCAFVRRYVSAERMLDLLARIDDALPEMLPVSRIDASLASKILSDVTERTATARRWLE